MHELIAQQTKEISQEIQELSKSISRSIQKRDNKNEKEFKPLRRIVEVLKQE